MRNIRRSNADEKWLKRLGKNIEFLILDAGYTSAYDFWINCAGDHISRASLNFILAGDTNPRATTLKTIADLLNIEISKLFEF